MFGLDVLHERAHVDRGAAAVLARMIDTQMLRPNMSPQVVLEEVGIFALLASEKLGRVMIRMRIRIRLSERPVV